MSRPPTQARLDQDGRCLAPRWMIASVLGRHPELISRHCTPLACDVYSRALLYDVDEAAQVLARVATWPPARVSNKVSHLRASLAE